MKLSKLIFLLSVFILSSCQKQHSQSQNIVNASTFQQKIETTENPQILDVRTPEEFNQEHIPNALNINWNGDNFEVEAEKLDKSKPVFVYCKSGGRSKKASAKLTELGFENVCELEGGFMQWSSEGLKSNKN
ncbi:rhodanese-like domain-containing protein [Flavobacterium faecale]|uniref:rhodanese-like domain-containing protein n=1 Tax=Flavobacterium faecale TaxID=1355330 RepID=UPI003AAA8FEE